MNHINPATSTKPIQLTSGEGSLLGLEVVGYSVGEVLIGRKEGSPLGGRVLTKLEDKEWTQKRNKSEDFLLEVQ